MKTYKVTYRGNSSRFKFFEKEVNAFSERAAVETVYSIVLDHSYFPQENGDILDCDGELVATKIDDTIEYDGGEFFAEEIN